MRKSLLVGGLLFALVGIAAAQAWQPVQSGVASTLNRVVFPSADRGYIVGNDGVVLQSIDAGASWHRLTMDASIDLYDISVLPTGVLVAVGERHSGGGAVVISVDSGASWIAPVVTPSTAISSVQFLDAAHGFAVAGASVYRTDDGGLTWTGQDIATGFLLNNVHFTDATHGMVSGGRHDMIGFVMRTNDGGRTWAQDGDTYVEPVVGLTSTGSTLWRVGGDFEFGAYLSRSNDGGATWSHTVVPSVQTSMMGVVFTDAQRGTAVGGRTIMETADAGASWTATQALSAGYFMDVTATPTGDRWAVGSGGTIMHAASVSGVREATTPVVDLLDAYPNPASHATELRFALPDRSDVALAVFDMNGNAVRSLLAGTKDSGSHTAMWDLTDDAGRPVSNGMYVCRMTVEGRTMMKRITVAR